MSLLQSLSQGSLFTEHSLVQSREGYLAIPSTANAAAAFEQWTRRMTTHDELTVAREMAGLPEETLSELAAVFARTPRRGRMDKLRMSIPVGGVLLLGSIALLMLNANLPASGVTAVLQFLGMACLLSGAVALCLGVFTAFSMMPLEVAHGRLGLCTSALNEQHPWLYKSSFVMRNDAANAYRQRVLTERGPLRGIDYIMMREIAAAEDAMEMTRVARTVAEKLSRVETTAVDAQTKERRLACVPNASTDTTGVPSPAPSVRSFGPTLTDRRRRG